MNMGNKKILGSLVLFLLLLLIAVPPSYAEKATSPAHPERPNVVWGVTERKTVIVHLVNTTEFPLEYVSSDFKDYYHNSPAQYIGMDDSNNQPGDPIAFSPSGIPHIIPKNSSASFVVSWLDTSVGGHSNSNVFPVTNMKYTMKNVISNQSPGNCPKGITSGDINIHMDFNRVDKSGSLKYDVFKLMLHSTSLLIDSTEMMENPIALMGFMTSATEIAEDASEIHSDSGSSDKVYFNAFVIAPGDDNDLKQIPEIHRTADISTTETASEAAPYDGLYTDHDLTTGCPQAYIIPVVAVQREVASSHGELKGSLPAVFVAFVTEPDFVGALYSQTQVSMQASPAGYKISQQLQREGRNSQIAFIKLARTLNHDDRALFDGAYKAIQAKRPLSREQESFLLRFANGLEKHEKSLQQAAPNKTQTPAAPVHTAPVRK